MPQCTSGCRRSYHFATLLVGRLNTVQRAVCSLHTMQSQRKQKERWARVHPPVSEHSWRWGAGKPKRREKDFVASKSGH